jgi:putative MATE family efflux protein
VRRYGEILTLAVPALGALLAEPVFLLIDTGIVGHLGKDQLAGLGAASAALSTLVSVCVFLAYGTTATVSRLVGAGDLPGAMRQGYTGLWLAACLGVGLSLVAVPLCPAIVSALGARDAALGHGVTYLRISAVGIPAMLVVLAASGVLRGLRKMRETLIVAVAGAAVNSVANLVLVYPVGLGIAGSALGTVIAQIAMAVALVAVTTRAASGHRISVRPDWAAIRRAGLASRALLVRTVALRIYLLAGTWVAASFGTAALAAHGAVSNIWTFLAMGLDAVAIAGQSIVGGHLGAGDPVRARGAVRRMIELGLIASVAMVGIVLLLRAGALPWFTEDARVRALMAEVLVLVALFQPVCAVAFVLDGVLIGAGDDRCLAVIGVITTMTFLASCGAVVWTEAGLSGLWWAVGLFMLVRAATLAARARSGRWMVIGTRV